MAFKGRNKEKQRRAFFSKMGGGKPKTAESIFFKPSEAKRIRAERERERAKFRAGLKITKRKMKVKKMKAEDLPFSPKYKKKKGWKDSDGDGVPDHKDCEPFNPKKQGWLHDLAIKRLKAKEEKLENVKQTQLNKLEDSTETLKERRNVLAAENDIRQRKMQQKQTIIDEIARERERIQDIKRQNQEAKKKLFETSAVGRATKKGKEISKDVLEKTEKFFKSPQTQSFARNVNRNLAMIWQKGKKTLLKRKRSPRTKTRTIVKVVDTSGRPVQQVVRRVQRKKRKKSSYAEEIGLV